MFETGSLRCNWTNRAAFASWHFKHRAFGSATSWAAKPEACGAWQLAHFPSAKGLCTDFAWASALIGAWQEKQSSLPFLTRPKAFSDACGEWHLTHSPLAAGTWTYGRASSALIVVWQLWQSSRTGCLTRCCSFEAWGVWHAMQLPAFAGAWTHAPTRYFLPKSSWHDSQRSKPVALSFFGERGFAARSWHEPQSPSTNGEWPTAGLKRPFFPREMRVVTREAVGVGQRESRMRLDDFFLLRVMARGTELRNGLLQKRVLARRVAFVAGEAPSFLHGLMDDDFRLLQAVGKRRVARKTQLIRRAFGASRGEPCQSWRVAGTRLDGRMDRLRLRGGLRNVVAGRAELGRGGLEQRGVVAGVRAVARRAGALDERAVRPAGLPRRNEIIVARGAELVLRRLQELRFAASVRIVAGGALTGGHRSVQEGPRGVFLLLWVAGEARAPRPAARRASEFRSRAEGGEAQALARLDGGWATFRVPHSFESAWQVAHSAAPSAFKSLLFADACGWWHDVQAPSRNGL